MPMEKISKYTKFFDLLIVGEKEECGALCELGKTYFRTLRYLPLSEVITDSLTCHILMIKGSASSISHKNARLLFSQIQRLDTFILSEDEITLALYKEALNLRAVYVGASVEDEQGFAQMLLSVLPSIIKRHNESLTSQFHKQIMENTEHQFWIHRNGKTLFANESFKRYFLFNALNEFDQSSASMELASIKTSGLHKLYNPKSGDHNFFVTVESLGESDTLIGLTEVKEGCKRCEKQFLNRISFIELLKDAFVIHRGEEESIPVVILLVENADKIVEEFGEKVYNEIGMEIYELAQKHFTPMSVIGQWHKNVFTLIDSSVSIKEITESLERLHANILNHISVQGATPMIESYVIDLDGVELNKAIRIIDHVHERKLIASDLSHMIYHEISYDGDILDIKDQALHYLEKLFYSKSQVRLLNFYKGIRISTIANIVKIAEGVVYMAIEKIQGYAMQLEESVVIQGTNVPFDIAAEIKIVDIGKKIALLYNFEPLKASANNRQHIRIQSDHRMHVTMSSQRQMSSGVIADISITSIALKMNSAIGIPPKGTEVTLQFNLPLKRLEGGMFPMIIKGHIEFIQEMEEYTKVVVLLKLEEPYESYLIEYIYARQQSLVSEIKSIVSKL